jgi:uncharacterized C2H2 Zn-finger protein
MRTRKDYLLHSTSIYYLFGRGGGRRKEIKEAERLK